MLASCYPNTGRAGGNPLVVKICCLCRLLCILVAPGPVHPITGLSWTQKIPMASGQNVYPFLKLCWLEAIYSLRQRFWYLDLLLKGSHFLISPFWSLIQLWPLFWWCSRLVLRTRNQGRRLSARKTSMIRKTQNVLKQSQIWVPILAQFWKGTSTTNHAPPTGPAHSTGSGLPRMTPFTQLVLPSGFLLPKLPLPTIHWFTPVHKVDL